MQAESVRRGLTWCCASEVPISSSTSLPAEFSFLAAVLDCRRG